MKYFYFLFGRDAVDRYMNDDIQSLNDPAIVNGTVFRYDETEMEPTDLLVIAIDWDDYCVIDESEYELLKSKGY
jgi:hypothetical protein